MSLGAAWPLGCWAVGFWAAGTWPVPLPPNPFPVDLVAYLAQSLPGLDLYPAVLPETGAADPAVTWQLIHAGRPLRLAGASGVVADRYQFNCWGGDALAVATLAEGLRSALQGFRGRMGTNVVRSCNLGPELTGWEPPVDASAGGRYRHTLEFAITRVERLG